MWCDVMCNAIDTWARKDLKLKEKYMGWRKLVEKESNHALHIQATNIKNMLDN